MTRKNKAEGCVFGAVLTLMAGSATADGPSPDPDQPVTSAAGGPATALISEGVVGRLLQSQGRPVAEAVITATSLDRPSRPVPDVAILTNSEGRFTWPLRAGTYRLAAVVAGRQVAEATATVEPGRVTIVDLSMAR